MKRSLKEHEQQFTPTPIFLLDALVGLLPRVSAYSRSTHLHFASHDLVTYRLSIIWYAILINKKKTKSLLHDILF